MEYNAKKEGEKMFTTWDTVFYTAAAITPGFLIDTIIRMKIPVQKRDASFAIFRFLVLSALNYAIWIWYIPSMYADENKLCAEFLYKCLGIIVGSPLLLGIIATWLASKDWFRKVLSHAGFNINNTAPSAWAYKFNNWRNGQSLYVIVTLKTGKQLRGKLGINSFSGNENEDEDLYMEECYNDHWEKPSRQDGCLICKNQIEFIEFIM